MHHAEAHIQSPSEFQTTEKSNDQITHRQGCPRYRRLARNRRGQRPGARRGRRQRRHQLCRFGRQGQGRRERTQSQRRGSACLQGGPGLVSRSRSTGKGRRQAFRPARYSRQQRRHRVERRGRRSRRRYRGARPPGRDQRAWRGHRDPCGVKTDGRRRTHRHHRFGHRHPGVVSRPRRLCRHQGCDRRLQQGRGARPRTARHYRERAAARLDRYRHESEGWRRVRRSPAHAARAATLRHRGRDRRRRRVPHQSGCVVRDRHGAECRWRLRRVIQIADAGRMVRPAPPPKFKPTEYPMIELRPFAKLGGADHGWLKAKHHFSFGSHYDPSNMGHGSLRVWNDYEIAPTTGFPAHPHANMEIITYVREGAITHQDSLGNKGRTEAGDVQVMSAGSGVRHSEYNLEPTKTKIFQIWIEPTTEGGQPTWGAKPFPKSDRSGNFVTIASGFDDDMDALPIRADARVLATTLKAGESAEYAPGKTRNLYLVPAAGAVEINGVRVNARDGVAIRDEARLKITALEDSELVLVDAA